jgi:hypothetical protein
VLDPCASTAVTVRERVKEGPLARLGRAREARRNTVECRQVMRDDDVIRFEVGCQHLLEGGVLLVHPRLDVLNERKVDFPVVKTIDDSDFKFQRSIDAKPSAARARLSKRFLLELRPRCVDDLGQAVATAVAAARRRAQRDLGVVGAGHVRFADRVR